MAKKVKTSLDFEKNEIQNVVVQKLATAPSSPVSGQIYYNTTQNAFYYYNGTAWVKCIETPSVSNVGIGETVYKGLNGSTLEFKSIQVIGVGLNIGSDTDNIMIELKPGEVDHALLKNPGINTHDQIDTHIASNSNPHNTTKSHVGLGSVDNVKQLPMSYLDTDGALGNSDIKVSSQKAVKTYVDNIAVGVSWKKDVRVATTANITLSGAQTIDGIDILIGDRVLVKNQNHKEDNGIYIVEPGLWHRAEDNDTDDEMLKATVLSKEGTTNAYTQWTCNTQAPIYLGSTSINFVQIGGMGSYSAGSGINIVGNNISVDENVVVKKNTTQTLTNKTLTTPVIEQWIYDSNGVKILLLTPIAAAVNQLEVTNAITANAPKLKAAGTDNHIDVDIVPKGTGRVKANNVVIPTISSTDTLTNKTIDAASNTISNIDTSNFKSGVLDTNTNLGTSDVKIPSQKAIKTFAEAKANARAGYYKEAISGNRGNVTGVTHACGTAPIVQVYETSSGNASLVEVDITIETSNGNVTWSTGTIGISGYIVIIGK